MKITHTWFSFIELIIVVSILSIIATFSLSSLSSNFEKQALWNEIWLLRENLINLENALGKDITDYEVYIQTGSFYYYYSNKNYKKISQNITFLGYTGTITTNDTVKNDLDIAQYFNDKKQWNFSFSSTWSYVFWFSPIWKYRMETTGIDTILNTINIEYYTQIDTKKMLQLDSIKDASNNTYTGIIIKNLMWWSKKIESMTWQTLSRPIEINFWYNGIPITLKLQ